MKPRAWSHSALSSFKTCPKAYYHKTILKDVVEEKGEATVWGEQVHKHFEDRFNDGVALPVDLAHHEAFLAKLEAIPGVQYVEQKIALNTRYEPCEFFAPDVWFRGVIDYAKICGRVARVVDFKTGKLKNDFQQLKLFAIHTFAAHPEVDFVRAEYYWTQTETATKAIYERDQVPQLWADILPDLKQFAQAFKTDTWQPRQSGLCGGWCPVTQCEFWRPKRKR